MNILVCGTRERLLPKQERAIAVQLYGFMGTHVLISGGATGVDSFAYGMAVGRGWPTRIFPADWETFGKAAGAIRNQQMIVENEVDLVLAFPIRSSKGTWDMVERAVKQRIPVRVYPI